MTCEFRRNKSNNSYGSSNFSGRIIRSITNIISNGVSANSIDIHCRLIDFDVGADIAIYIIGSGSTVIDIGCSLFYFDNG